MLHGSLSRRLFFPIFFFFPRRARKENVRYTFATGQIIFGERESCDQWGLALCRAAVGLEGGGHQLAHAPDHPCLNIRVRRRELGVLRPVEAQVEQAAAFGAARVGLQRGVIVADWPLGWRPVARPLAKY